MDNLQTIQKFFFFQAEDGIRDVAVTGVQTCALPISRFASASVIAITCSAMGAAYAPGLLATMICEGRSANGIWSAPAEMSWMNVTCCNLLYSWGRTSRGKFHERSILACSKDCSRCTGGISFR